MYHIELFIRRTAMGLNFPDNRETISQPILVQQFLFIADKLYCGALGSNRNTYKSPLPRGEATISFKPSNMPGFRARPGNNVNRRAFFWLQQFELVFMTG